MDITKVIKFSFKFLNKDALAGIFLVFFAGLFVAFFSFVKDNPLAFAFAFLFYLFLYLVGTYFLQISALKISGVKVSISFFHFVKFILFVITQFVFTFLCFFRIRFLIVGIVGLIFLVLSIFFLPLLIVGMLLLIFWAYGVLLHIFRFMPAVGFYLTTGNIVESLANSWQKSIGKTWHILISYFLVSLIAIFIAGILLFASAIPISAINESLRSTLLEAIPLGLYTLVVFGTISYFAIGVYLEISSR